MSDTIKPREDRYIVTSRPSGTHGDSGSPSVSITYIVEATGGNKIHVTDRASLRRAVAAAMKDRKAVD